MRGPTRERNVTVVIESLHSQIAQYRILDRKSETFDGTLWSMMDCVGDGGLHQSMERTLQPGEMEPFLRMAFETCAFNGILVHVSATKVGVWAGRSLTLSVFNGGRGSAVNVCGGVTSELPERVAMIALSMQVMDS